MANSKKKRIKVRNSPSSIPSKKQNVPKNKKRRRRGKRTLTYVILITIFIVVATILSFTVLFKVEDVTVFGSVQYSADEIIKATGVTTEDNLFLVPTKKIEEQLLKEFPYIEEVSVERAYPPQIVVNIEPSIAVVALEQNSNNYVLISYSGKILEQGLSLPSSDSLLVKGVSINNMSPGMLLGEPVLEKIPEDESKVEKEKRQEKNKKAEEVAEDQEEVLRMIHYFFEAMDKSKLKNLTNLDISDRYNMTVMYENRILLKLGSESNLQYKLDFAYTVLEELDSNAHGAVNLAEARKNIAYYEPAEGYDKNGVLLALPKTEEEESSSEESSEKDT